MALLCSVACASADPGDAPECPPWTVLAIADLENMQALGLYPELEIMIGTQEAHCIALEAWNRGRYDTCEGGHGWLGWFFRLRCWE